VSRSNKRKSWESLNTQKRKDRKIILAGREKLKKTIGSVKRLGGEIRRGRHQLRGFLPGVGRAGKTNVGTGASRKNIVKSSRK